MTGLRSFNDSTNKRVLDRRLLSGFGVSRYGPKFTFSLALRTV